MNLSCKNLTNLPSLPEVVLGSLNCSDNKLTDLIGSPKEVKGDYACQGNKLNNLIGSPSHIGGFFGCSFNELTSLVGLSKYIGAWFTIKYNSNLLDISDIWSSSIKDRIYFDLNKGMAILPLIKFERLRCENGELESIHLRSLNLRS